MVYFYKKIKLDNLAKFFDTTRQTIARWKTEDNKLALVLTHKYLDDEKINEFITTGKIEKFEKMNEPEVLNQNIVNVIFKDIDNNFDLNEKSIWVIDIFKKFAIETEYKPIYSEMRDFLNNDDKEKEDFHENFTLFLHKNKARFLYKYRLKAEQMMCKILDKNDIYIFYYLKYISDFQNK